MAYATSAPRRCGAVVLAAVGVISSFCLCPCLKGVSGAPGLYLRAADSALGQGRVQEPGCLEAAWAKESPL